jgi:outer membrane protein TolC
MTDRASRHPELTWLLIFLTFLPGCVRDSSALHYLGEESIQYYRDAVSQIDYPDVDQESPEQVIATQEPRTINSRAHDEIWEMSLSEAVLLAMQNNRVIRDNGTFMSPFNALFSNPARVPSVYDPAIQASGVLFGGRGVESALAAFDARWDTSMLWGRNSQFLNVAATPGAFSTAETANFNTSLSKAFGYGGQMSLSHDVNYLGTNSQTALFPSSYFGSLSASYRHPLLAGAGTEFTQIAGPITQSFGGITGVTQGVVIARINQDITLADFEASVQALVLDVENLYWDLYLSYMQYDTAVNARRSAQRTWRDLKEEVDLDDREFERQDDEGAIQRIAYQQNPLGGFNQFQQQAPRNIKADEAQARDAYFQARAATEQALSTIYSTETQLRRLLGLPVNDGRVIRPAEQPMTGEFVPDWYSSLAEALTRRVELRRQKWSIKSLDLQLIAAKSLTRPRLDLVGSAALNGFGDDLIGPHTADGVSNAGLNNFYGTLTRGDQTGWGLGVEMSVPIGFRSAHAQVRNVELMLAKAREVLSVQEMEISHEMARSVQSLVLSYQNMQTLQNRWLAAREFVRIRLEEKNAGVANTDLLLRAINSLAQAENAYHISLIDYNKALADFQFRKGAILEHNNILVAENEWDPEAYEDALRRARERSTAFDNPLLKSKPPEFSTGPNNHHEVYFENRIEPRDADDEEDSVPPETTPGLPPAPAIDSEPSSTHSTRLDPEQERTRDLASRTDPLGQRKTLSLRKLPESIDRASSDEVATSPKRITRSMATANAEVPRNPVELLSVSLDTDTDPEPAQHHSFAEYSSPTPTPMADPRTAQRAVHPALSMRPLVQPIPSIHSASSLVNRTPRMNPVPEAKVKAHPDPPIRSPRSATAPSTVAVPGTHRPQSDDLNASASPAPQAAPVSQVSHSPDTSHAPRKSHSAEATVAPTIAPESAPPAAPAISPAVREEPAPVRSPVPSRRATEIELFE